jgi:predicted enzyme related to lactoylglutathione lyase
MLKGFATLAYYAADLDAAEKWYSEVLGITAYFHVPGYVEFRVGDYQNELGIIDAQYAPSLPSVPAGEIIQWHVEDLEAALERLLTLGATEYQPITDRGHGFRTAAVVDPFGNILGIMYNPHYVAVRELVQPQRADFGSLEG